jgi:hypothetical protein
VTVKAESVQLYWGDTAEEEELVSDLVPAD